MSLRPPPCSGQILVKNSYKCAAIRPVAWCKAASGEAMTNVIASIEYGRYLAENVTIK
jgi:hypothetical protein